MAITSKLKHMKIGRRAFESENLPNNWEFLNLLKLNKIKDKSIFMFGGNTTTRPEATNGNAKILKALLETNTASSTQIFSILYESEPLKNSDLLSKEYEQDTHILYKETFMPMLFDENGNIKQKKGIEQAFGKLVFAAHCAGCNFVDIIIEDFYNTLTQYYPPSTAELLINKIQYFAYAPKEMPPHNINAFIVAPYNDPDYCWSKTLDFAEESKIDVDYPKGIVKKLIKYKKQLELRQFFTDTFKETRAIAFKSGHTTIFIPGTMNPRTTIGDHSIECIAKSKILNSGTNYEHTAQLANYASKLYINGFLANSCYDTKLAFNKLSCAIEDASSITLEQ